MKRTYDKIKGGNYLISEPQIIYGQFLTNSEIVLRARSGYNFKELTAFLNKIHKKLEDLASILGVSLRTLQRYSSEKQLSISQSERLLHISRLYGHGYDVFSDQSKFHEWMDMPNILLGGVSPFSLLDTHSGIQMVDELVGRIEHGVYS